MKLNTECPVCKGRLYARGVDSLSGAVMQIHCGECGRYWEVRFPIKLSAFSLMIEEALEHPPKGFLHD